MSTYVTGVMLVTGEHGVGKTRFALEAGDPQKTILIDDDQKGKSTIQRMVADGIEFGKYVDFIDMCDGLKPNGLHKKGLQLIEDIKPGEYEVIVWDTWTRFAESCRFYVMSNPNLFREENQWARNGAIKGGEMNKTATLYEADIISRLQKKVPLVVLVSHLKNQYINNTRTGKEIPAVSRAVGRVCNLRLWIRHNPASSTPIALTLKNIERNIMVDGRLRTIQVLPTKISPLNNEENFEPSLWDSIKRYLDNPIGNRKPTKDETPDDFEMSIVQGTLTEDQRLSWLYALKAKKQEEQEEATLLEIENKSNAVEMFNNGKSVTQISKELGVELQKVAQWISQK